jgi:hypothetical protein
MREFFGLIEPYKIMTSDIINNHDFTFDVKYAVYIRKKTVFSLTGCTLVGIGNNSKSYWREVLGVEVDFGRTSSIASMFATYSLDKKWFDSRDKLLEIGVRFAK